MNLHLFRRLLVRGGRDAEKAGKETHVLAGVQITVVKQDGHD